TGRDVGSSRSAAATEPATARPRTTRRHGRYRPDRAAVPGVVSVAWARHRRKAAAPAPASTAGCVGAPRRRWPGRTGTGPALSPGTRSGPTDRPSPTPNELLTLTTTSSRPGGAQRHLDPSRTKPGAGVETRGPNALGRIGSS